MQSFSLGQNQISILPGRRPDAPVIYLPSVKDEGACISRYLLESGCPDLTLISISDLSWNHDMAPWDCPAVFPKGDPFTGGADAYIHQLTEQILPEAERRIGSEPVWRGIAGYSLAGCSPSIRSITQICFPELPVCPVLCGFPASPNTWNPIPWLSGRTVFTFLLERRSTKQEIRS